MRDEQQRFLMLGRQMPGRLTVEQVGWVLGCEPHSVPVLVGARLLKPLGSPPPNGVKYFATVEILELARDRAWLGKMSNALVQYWRKRNGRKKDREFLLEPAGVPLVSQED